MEMKSGLDIGHFNIVPQCKDQNRYVWEWYFSGMYACRIFTTFIVLFYVLQCSNYGILKMHECLAKRV